MKVLNILYALTVVALLSACTKKIELKDPQTLVPEAALSTDANVKKVLAGAYDAISSASFYGGDIQLFADLLAADGEISWTGTFNTYREVFGKNILKTNPIISATWGAGYETINIANSVIKAIDVVNDEDQDRVKGEALFLRGSALFELTRFFAKTYNDGSPSSNLGVPILLEPTAGVTEIVLPTRSTVEQCYQQVIADLSEAFNLLPDDEDNEPFATKSAAAAMLSRVYLQKADYAGALAAANDAIDNADGKSLMETYPEVFNTNFNTPEDLFSMQVSDQDGSNDLQLFYSVPDYGGRDGDVVINDKHLAFYTTGDARLDFFYFNNDAYRSGKWRDLYMNVKVIRLAEVYLTRAEANARLGMPYVGASPEDDLDLIRSRAGLPFIASPTLDTILHERKLELAQEGFGIHDARRLELTVDGRAFNDNSLVFPIPQREINVNPGLQQNPGY